METDQLEDARGVSATHVDSVETHNMFTSGGRARATIMLAGDAQVDALGTTFVLAEDTPLTSDRGQHTVTCRRCGMGLGLSTRNRVSSESKSRERGGNSDVGFE